MPVWVLEKNPMGWPVTWSKTSERSWKMSPSPILAEHQRWTRPMPALTTATPATVRARPMTSARSFPITPWSTILCSSSGGTTPATASKTTHTRNTAIMPR